MTFRETTHAVLHYQPYDKIPVVSFGYWAETVQKWAAQGHITQEEADDYCRSGDNGAGDRAIMKKLGFDFNWNSCVGASVDLFPHFARQTLEVRPDGGRVEPFHWKIFFLVLGSVLVFSLLLASCGLMIAIAAMVMISALADKNFRLKETLIVIVVLDVIAWVIFVYGVGMLIPVWPAFL